jgi:branched-chain amino acid transport system permease protein
LLDTAATALGRVRSTALPVALLVALGVFLLALPDVVGSYGVRVATSILMFAVLAQAWNIIAGFAGYPAFGNTAFFGIGAYVVAILMRSGVPFEIALAGAGIIALIACGVIGGPILRLRGHYFAIGTFAVALATRELISNGGELTGSVSGMVLPFTGSGSPLDIARPFYLWMLGILAACTAVVYWISRSRYGYALRSIKADEDAAATFGIDTQRYKLSAWMLSALFTALAGGVWATWIGFIDPPSAFHLTISLKFSVIALLGGLGSVAGPILGAIIVEGSTEYVWGSFVEYHLAALGVVIIFVVLLMPGGLMRVIRDLRTSGVRRVACRIRVVP